MPKAKTWEEYKTECEAIAKEGITILGFIEPWRGIIKTKLVCSCEKHGCWNTTSIQNFLKGISCPQCGILVREETKKKNNTDLFIKEFLATGKFKTGTKFWRSNYNAKTSYEKRFWSYTCPTCSSDEYVKAGLCSGIFKGSIDNLKKGQLSCRCSSRFLWTKEQRQYQISKRIEEENLPYTFINWETDSHKLYGRFVYDCKYHGLKSMSINNFLNGLKGCPECFGGLAFTQAQANEIVNSICSNKGFTYKTFIYHNNNTRISMKCKDKTHPAWKVSFKNLTKNNGSGCPSCAGNKLLSQKQAVGLVEEVCKGKRYTYQKFSYLNAKTKITLKCENKNHSPWVATFNSIVHSGKGCPECANKVQQQCYINFVYDNGYPMALKFGIANSSKDRLKGQNRKNVFQMEQTHIYEFPSVQQCKDAEKACKSELQCGILSSRELKDGWTETTSILNMDKIIEIYERFGGVLIKGSKINN